LTTGFLKLPVSEIAKSHLAMLAVSALVAGSFSLGSLAANTIDPRALNTVRFGLAGLLLLGLVRMRLGGVPKAAYDAPWRYLLLGGLFSLYFVLMFEGLKTAPPVSAAAVYATTPLLSAVFGYLLLSQSPSARMSLAMIVGALGALWVIFRADLAALLAFEIGRGEAIYFMGCLAHSLYVPLVRVLNRGEGALVFTFGTIIGGTIALVGYGWTALISTDWLSLPVIAWVVIGYTAVFATAASFVLTQYAAMRLSAANVMAYTYLVPIWVIVWQLVLVRDLPPTMVLLGVMVIVMALVSMLRETG
jgi:drug/metabolite transporter (DMT)-like permease